MLAGASAGRPPKAWVSAVVALAPVKNVRMTPQKGAGD
jgi:hypothetical protein